MATRSSGPRRRPAPPHVQEKVRRVQAREVRAAPAPITKGGGRQKKKAR